MLLNLNIALIAIASILCVIKSTPTVPNEIVSGKHNLFGANSKYVEDRGFVLTKASIFHSNGMHANTNPGIKLTFTSCSGAQRVILFESDSLVGVTEYSQAITQQVVGVDFCFGT